MTTPQTIMPPKEDAWISFASRLPTEEDALNGMIWVKGETTVWSDTWRTTVYHNRHWQPMVRNGQYVMPLEEVIASLKEDALIAHQMGEAGLAARLDYALHHLEAGKRDSARYLKLRAHAESEFIQIEGRGFSGYFEEGKDLDAAIDCLPEPPSTTPTEEVQP